MSGGPVAIVGANLAGGCAALALRANGFEDDIVLIGAEPHPPYERPPLSKAVLTGTATPESTYVQPSESYADARIDLRLGITVARISRRWQALELVHGSTITAQIVLLCTGGRPRRLHVPGADLEGVHYLRTIEDAAAIRDRFGSGVPVVVVGAGFIGAEVAACAREVGCEVTMLEVADLPLGRVLGPDLGEFYARLHRDRGVDLRTGTSITAIEGDAGRVQRVVTGDGAVIEAALVVVGIGMDPAVELAEGAGIEVADGIVVDEHCRTSVPGVYAAGDVASHPSVLLGRHVRLEHWSNAKNQAAAAAQAIQGHFKPFDEVPWFWSDQYDMNLQVVGHPDSTADVVVRGDPDEGSFTTFYLREDRLTGAVAVNRPRDARGATRLIESGVLPDRRALADDDVDMRRLVGA